MNSEFDRILTEDKPVVLTPVDVPPRSGIRLHHMMYWIGICAVVFWLSVVIGAWFFALSFLLIGAVAIGLVVVLLRRSSSRRESLLWALAVAAERSMPLSEAALAFSDQYGRAYRWRVHLLATLLNEGVPLPEAMSQVPGALSREAEVLVRTGYSTGTLAQSLREAAGLRSAQASAWGTTAGRFAYLGWVLLVMQTISGFILYFVIPKFEAIFMDFGVSLPQVTVWTIEASHFLIRYFYLFAPFMLLAEVMIPAALVVGAMNSYALWWDVPLIDYLFRRRHSSMVLRALGLAVSGGKPIPTALGLLAVDYPSSWVRRRLARVEEDVSQGRDWVESLLHRSLLRPADVAVLESAQRLGNLEWALREMADSNERRLGYRFEFWVQILFPVLIVALGAVVFLFCVAYFSPLVRLIEALAG